MTTMLYTTIFQKRIPVEARFGAREVKVERMLKHLEISLPYPPQRVGKEVDRILVELSKSPSLSASSRIASILLALLGLFISGLGILESLLVLALVLVLLGGAIILYAYSKYEEKHSRGAYPDYYYRERLKSWLIDLSRVAASRPAGSRGRVIIGGLVYDYYIRKKRDRIYVWLKPV